MQFQKDALIQGQVDHKSPQTEPDCISGPVGKGSAPVASTSDPRDASIGPLGADGPAGIPSEWSATLLETDPWKLGVTLTEFKNTLQDFDGVLCAIARESKGQDGRLPYEATCASFSYTAKHPDLETVNFMRTWKEGFDSMCGTKSRPYETNSPRHHQRWSEYQMWASVSADVTFVGAREVTDPLGKRFGFIVLEGKDGEQSAYDRLQGFAKEMGVCVESLPTQDSPSHIAEQ